MSRKDANREQVGTSAFGPGSVQRHWCAVCAAGAAVIAVCIGVKYLWPQDHAEAAAPVQASQQVPEVDPQIVAVVNGEKVSRDDLAADCLRHFGKDVLESLINKELILDVCKARGIKVTKGEIDQEIERMATRFKVPVEQWYTLLKKERGIDPEQYRRDIIWPTLALRKIAAERLTVTDEELHEAIDSQFGAQVKVRLIGIHGDPKKAAAVQAEAAANPTEFTRLVREKSDDTESASVNGWVPPVRKGGPPELVKVAFALKEGEVSPVVELAKGYYAILLCEGQLPAQQVDVEKIRPQIEELIKEKKLRDEATKLFGTLQKESKVENVYNNVELRQKLPGVAALINGAQIPLVELEKECLERHGRDTLEGLVNRRLIEQELRRRKLAVADQDLWDEVDSVAARNLPLIDGQPDRKGWIKKVTEEPGVTQAMYFRDSVWPSAAMKILCKDGVKVTEDDLQKAFAANYGPRVRCLAIVVDDMRRAKEIWDKASKNRTRDNFMTLSEMYSTDPSVKSLRGEIPPIQKFGGRPAIEQEAFTLKEGEMSSIIEADGKCVILWCDGTTQTMKVAFDEVRNELYDLVFRQKLNVLMSQKFDDMQRNALVVNYLEPAKSRKPAAANGSSPHGPAATAKRQPRVGEVPPTRTR